MSSQYPHLDNRPINQWKVTELRDELRRRNLPMNGLKEDLVRRLNEAISDNRETVDGELNGNINPGSNPPSDCDEEDEPLLLVGDSVTMEKSGEKTNEDFTSLTKDGDNDDAEMSTKAQDVEAVQPSSDVITIDEITVDVTCMEDSITCNENLGIKLDSSSEGSQNHKKGDEVSKVPSHESEVNHFKPKHTISDLSHSDPTMEASECNKKGEDSKLFLEDVAIDPSRSYNQVSKVSPDLGFQVKSEPISTDSVSINDKNELEDYLNADNFHLELDNVKQETTKPSSSYVPSISGDELLLDDGKVFVECSIAIEEVDVTNISDMDFMKKNESGDGSPEKLNLDRSSGDESMEEDAHEGKHLESISNEVEMKNEISKVPTVEEKNVDNIAVTGVTSVKMDGVAEVEMNPPDLAEKRKLEEIQAVISEAPKRQRRWFTKNIEVAEIAKPNIKVLEVGIHSLTTPKDSVQPTPRRLFTRSESGLDVDSSKEQIVLPSEKPSTTSLRVDHFLRPFTLKAVQELLAKNGTVCKFWMDHIKTHCYVTYSSVEEAVAARKALYNLQWPTNGGRRLIADFVDPQEVDSRADAPQQSPVPATPSITTAEVSQPSPHLYQHRQAPLAPIPSSAPPFQNLPVKEWLPPPPPPQKQEVPLVVTLDDLFKKTITTPRIYYLPLSEKQVEAKLATRHMV